MTSEYVEAREGGLFAIGSRVSLASIVYAFLDGASPETIRESFPSLSLAQVYGAVAFHLNHPRESERYFNDLSIKWKELEQKAEPPGEDLREGLV